jgi:hypothetical protein
MLITPAFRPSLSRQRHSVAKRWRIPVLALKKRLGCSRLAR